MKLDWTAINMILSNSHDIFTSDFILSFWLLFVAKELLTNKHTSWLWEYKTWITIRLINKVPV